MKLNTPCRIRKEYIYQLLHCITSYMCGVCAFLRKRSAIETSIMFRRKVYDQKFLNPDHSSHPLNNNNNYDTTQCSLQTYLIYTR